MNAHQFFRAHKPSYPYAQFSLGRSIVTLYNRDSSPNQRIANARASLASCSANSLAGDIMIMYGLFPLVLVVVPL